MADTFLFAPFEDTVVVISEATWRAEQRWDDEDPFETLAEDFNLIDVSECVYESFRGTSEAVANSLTLLRQDPRFTEDLSILP